MDVDKLCPNCLEIVDMGLGIQAVSVGIPALSIFRSMTEEDTCLFSTVPWWSLYTCLRHLILLPLVSLAKKIW